MHVAHVVECNESLGHYFKIEDSFAKDLKSCINSHEKVEEFFQAWEAFLIYYNLMGWDGPEPMIHPLWVAGPI